MSETTARRQLAQFVEAADERSLRAALCRLLEPDEWTVDADRVIGACGVVDAFARFLDPSAVAHDHLREALTPRLPELDVVADLGRGVARGARFVIPGDDEWPARLDALPRPPYGLWIRGSLHLSELTDRSVAIIGSRASSAYGERVASELTATLALRGWTVVSGGAYGIDAAAHRAALAVPTPTVAVLASGVDVPYPVAHTSMIERIAESGLVVSEQPPGDSPRQLRFLARNRIVAALTRGTVVVEAGPRSGTSTTARQAAGLSRAVMVVPGPVDSWASRGCHELLRRDPTARLVADAGHIVEEVGSIGIDLAPEVRGPARTRDGLKINMRRVLDAVPVHDAVPPARLVASAAMSRANVETALKDLRRLGFIEVTPAGGVRLSASERARRGRREADTCGTIGG
jgi:DNA processing protein